jgi:ABC-2 type transport system permease protein
MAMLGATLTLPGLAGMGVITNAYSNSSTSLFMARIDRSIENIVTAPISPLRIVLAFVVGGVSRGLVVGGVTLIVAALMTDLPLESLPLLLLMLLVLSITFSSLGIVSALWAEDWDHLATMSTFFITPSVYLGGVFYSIGMLPPLWRKISLLNPMLYLIDAFRASILGVSDLPLVFSVGVSVVLAAAALGTAVWLFRIGYKIIV